VAAACGGKRGGVNTELVGPLPLIRFSDNSVQAYTPPRNTGDIRYAVCTDHHPACDCREAHLAEDISEYRTMFRELERAILDAIKGHQTYAYSGESDAGQIVEDTFGQCKCPVCAIARAAHIGHAECLRQHREAWARVAAERAEADRAYCIATYPDLDEVPF
jgi:hypothetical protein